MPRRSFDKPFKISAVKLIAEEGFSVKEVSRELCVHTNSLYRWVQEVEKYGEIEFTGKGSALLMPNMRLKN
ncbi:transposase [Enterococcus faecalis]|nr:transposase [Enterococcus faecalis]